MRFKRSWEQLTIWSGSYYQARD